MTGPGGRTVPILGNGSRLGARLRSGAFRLVQAYRPRPGTVLVDDTLAARLDGSYFTKPVPARKLKGVGQVQPLVLRRLETSEQVE